jgi:DNA-binding NtrC family response regulator
MALRDQLQTLVEELVVRGVSFEDARREFEKAFIARTLSGVDGNLCQAADRLGMHRNTLSRKITEYRLRRP